MAGLTLRKINATHPDREIRIWDDNPRGLGLRIKPSGVKTFFIQYRSPTTGKKVRHAIGQFGRLTLEEARTKAKELFGAIAEKKDPAREEREARQKIVRSARTMIELCDDYLTDAKTGRSRDGYTQLRQPGN